LLKQQIEGDLRSGMPYGIVLAKLENQHGIDHAAAEELAKAVLAGIWGWCDRCRQVYHSSIGTCLYCGSDTEVKTRSRDN
jgi:hypothetical protein